MKFVLGLSDIKAKDSRDVGNRVVSTGRIHQETQVPVEPGFVITSTAFERFLQKTDLRDKIDMLTDGLNADNPRDVQRRGKQIRSQIKETEMPKQIRERITGAYRVLSDRSDVEDPKVSLRVSPNGGDSKTRAQVQNTEYKAERENELIKSVRDCFASLYSNRNIEQRSNRHLPKASVTVQRLDSSKIKTSGTAYTFHPKSGHPDVITVEHSRPESSKYQGDKKRDTIFKNNLAVLSRGHDNRSRKNTLSENNLKELGKQAIRAEEELQTELKLKWVLTNQGKVFVLEADPQEPPNIDPLPQRALKEKSEILVTGEPVESGIKSGKAKVIDSPSHTDELNKGDILIVDKLDERWKNLIEKASAVVANRKINLRQTEELLNEGIPVLAQAGTGTSELISGEEFTVECSASKGAVYKGELAKTSRNLNLENTEKATEVYLDISDRERVFKYSRLPVDGARITDLEGVLTGNQNKSSASPKSKKEYVKSLKSGISRVCAAFHPRPVTAELSRAGVEKLLHDSEHGTSSQIELEIKAIERCIAELGFENLEILLPPLATVETARELKSKILEIQSEIENVGFHASVESPEYVTQSRELLQEFQGLDLKTGNLIENMKGGLSETNSLDTDELLQDIIRQTRAQAASKPKLCVNIGQNTEYLKPSVQADADSLCVKPEEIGECLVQLAKPEDRSKDDGSSKELKTGSDRLEVSVETSIGGTAGEVYDRLAEKGEVQADALIDDLGGKVKERKIHQALGWLAKEGKISIHRNKNKLTYSLK